MCIPISDATVQNLFADADTQNFANADSPIPEICPLFHSFG